MKKKWEPIDLNQVTTYPIHERSNKVSIDDFASPPSASGGLKAFLSGLPKILKAADLLEFIEHLVAAHRRNKPIIVMMGGHVIKCGLSPILIDLMERGIVTALAFNGASSIHDFEIALIGETSEEVSEYLQTGRFGMVEETGRFMNEAFREAVDVGIGMGEGLGRKLIELGAPHSDYSLLVAGVRLGVPITVHVAIGTDIIHQHPLANGAKIGEATFTDFRIFTSIVSELGDGGVLINLGSAVLLPEVFLKALTISRNLGHRVTDFITANFDMLQQYRPLENVVKRPTSMGGHGYTFTGHHELMVPLLAHALRSRLTDDDQ